ncbi:MAG: DUF1929 domain-containing protein [Planctomycetes bacterium]|nr:DUF1929 domain-containing protein [Planctomycetota bacterium]
MFCSGHTWTKDGKLIIMGGNAKPGGDVVDTCPGGGNNVQLADVGYVFDPANSTFTKISNTMGFSRWYPMAITLDTDEVLVLGGSSGTATASGPIKEWNIYTPGTPSGTNPWTSAFDASNPTTIATYPRVFQLSDGSTIMLSDQEQYTPFTSLIQIVDSYRINYAAPAPPASGVNVMTTYTGLPYTQREDGTGFIIHQLGQVDRVFWGYGSAFGNNTGAAPPQPTPTNPWPALNTIDEFSGFGFGTPMRYPKNPAFGGTGAPAFGRQYANSVILPTGRVVIVGGSENDYKYSNAIQSGLPSAGEFPVPLVPPSTAPGSGAVAPMPVFEPELFDIGLFPNLPGFWSKLNRHICPRLYHSTALLLPDGRIMCLGGVNVPGLTNSDQMMEVLSPPYLFQGPRPRILGTPNTNINYGGSLQLSVDIRNNPTNQSIKAVLMRPGSVTHAFDADQRYIELAVTHGTPTGTAFSLNIAIPPNPTGERLAPPGWYMLFVVSPPPAGAPSWYQGIPSVALWVNLQ